jgi:hypothetical protein
MRGSAFPAPILDPGRLELGARQRARRQDLDAAASRLTFIAPAFNVAAA